MKQLWHRIRDGIPTSLQVALVGQYAEAAACEAIQVAAMARKYIDMLERIGRVRQYSTEMRQYLDEIRRYENWRYGNGEEKESQPIPNTGDAG